MIYSMFYKKITKPRIKFYILEMVKFSNLKGQRREGGREDGRYERRKGEREVPSL